MSPESCHLNHFDFLEFINRRLRENNFDKLFFNNTFGVDENNRDSEIIKLLEDKRYEYEHFDDQILFKPGSIQTNEGKPYSVFTPFKRKWLEFFNIDLLDMEYSYSAKNKKCLESNIDNFHTPIVLILIYGRWVKRALNMF